MKKHFFNGLALARKWMCEYEFQKIEKQIRILECYRKCNFPMVPNVFRFISAFRIRIRIHTDPLHLAGSGSTSIPAPDPNPLRFLFPDPEVLIWIQVAPKQTKTMQSKK